MPGRLSRALTGRHRTPRANRQLGLILAFNAGALNAGGFLAVQQYTSHLTGVVSAVADRLALGQWALALDGLLAVLAFLLGAMTCAILVNHARSRGRASEYALPLLLEAALILVFGLLGARLTLLRADLVPFTVLLLCYIMGLQNAVVTKLSRAVIRTTHMTGVITDLGIELGKLAYRGACGPGGPDARLVPPSGTGASLPVPAERERLGVLAGLLVCFLGGGVTGAAGFGWLGYGFTLPLAFLLAGLALAPAVDDLWRA